jgi:hypothetical protein
VKSCIVKGVLKGNSNHPHGPQNTNPYLGQPGHPEEAYRSTNTEEADIDSDTTLFAKPVRNWGRSAIVQGFSEVYQRADVNSFAAPQLYPLAEARGKLRKFQTATKKFFTTVGMCSSQ